MNPVQLAQIRHRAMRWHLLAALDLSRDQGMTTDALLPIIQSVREHEILNDFPKRTESDLYLWVIDHQHYLREHVRQEGCGDSAQPRALWCDFERDRDRHHHEDAGAGACDGIVGRVGGRGLCVPSGGVKG